MSEPLFFGVSEPLFESPKQLGTAESGLICPPRGLPVLTQRPLFVYIDGAKTTSLVVYLSDKTELPQSCKKKICSIFLNFGSIDVN